MVRGLITLLALLLALWSSLTWLAAHSVPVWKMAVAAGAFGHLLAFAAAAVAVAGVRVAKRGHRLIGSIILLAGLVAVVGFLRPVVMSWRMAADLDEQLIAAFGGPPAMRRPFAWTGLVTLPERFTAGVVTRVFAGAGTPDELVLDLYRPASAAPAPVVVMIHGGGWDSGDREQFRGFNHELAAKGFAVAAISYRLAPAHQWPAQRDDVLAAIRWLKDHATAWHLDTTRLVLFGRSAGGQIATAVGYGAADPAIKGVIAFYAPHDMRFVWSIAAEDDVLNSVKLMRQYLGGPPGGPLDAAYESASGQRLVRPGTTPPTLLVHGRIDELVWAEHSRRLARELKGAGIPAVFVEVPWGTHALDFYRAGPGGQLCAYLVLEFLERVLGTTGSALQPAGADASRHADGH